MAWIDLTGKFLQLGGGLLRNSLHSFFYLPQLTRIYEQRELLLLAVFATILFLLSQVVLAAVEVLSPYHRGRTIWIIF